MPACNIKYSAQIINIIPNIFLIISSLLPDFGKELKNPVNVPITSNSIPMPIAYVNSMLTPRNTFCLAAIYVNTAPNTGAVQGPITKPAETPTKNGANKPLLFVEDIGCLKNLGSGITKKPIMEKANNKNTFPIIRYVQGLADISPNNIPPSAAAAPRQE